MRIKDQLNYIRDSLQPWAQANGGKVHLAMKVSHLFAMLSSPGGFRVAVKYIGEEKRGEYEELGFVDRKFWVAFSFGESLKLEKGDALTDGQGGGPPLADLAEDLRDQVRALTFEGGLATEGMPNYLRMAELGAIADGFLIEGYFIEFTIGCQLPNPPGN